ncbi:S8 family peptidase [Aliiglaciecola lipolytica]|uniref:Peptidase S8/S53 subtilisin kexin sedolisin n=1 Tax=Aliiglaciecola lipolytica E3 TaxID=1127673 RepID=K6XWW0_9ALTE|nr:S8 family serine peptidase [Aliiglaciecola lipolytica]GAC16146.1 peptidase S8/S53 subtilisin kexin sedolisin [Aliiglaciecola lipolytica E3]
MKKYTLTAIATAMLSLSPNAVKAEALIGEQLADSLITLAENQSIMAVVTFDQLDPVTESQLSHILSLGISEGVQFKSLPIIGVLATKAQIEQLAQLDNVLSIFANRKMQYYNADARQITGVADLQTTDFEQRNGITYTGKGVTIMVNDSGVDASHQDIFFGDTVVENVQALTHASAIGITGMTDGFVLTGQINTDTNSGHGTHVAGTIAGSGVMSDGKYVGAAPDADIIGYGSGGGLFLLDTIGGFDFAINNIYSYNSPIKIISNSWGSSGKYEPLGPVSVATYKAHKLGIMSVFAAGNSGPGEDTNNPYAQIPWGLSVGAGDKFGKLADFSSRGLKSESGEFSMPDGSTWTYNNEVSIVAPGVDIISTRAVTNLVANGADADLDAIETEYVPFYTMISGTSMATPHVSGIIALMLEANPNLDNLEIIKILQETATNMPGYERWEVGAGYVNARSAVAAALDYDLNHRVTVNNLTDKTFNANANVAVSDRTEQLELFYAPVGEPEIQYFDVEAGTTIVKASASTLANLTKLVLVAPDGTEYFGNLTTPVLEENMRVSAPATPGTWGIYAYGLTSLSGVTADPLGVTNGPGVPEFFDVEVAFEMSGGYDGLDDVEGHPQKGAIEFAVSERLMDSIGDDRFYPNSALKRKDFARYAMMGGAVRQYRDLLNEPTPMLSGVSSLDKPYLESVMTEGGALKDNFRSQAPILLPKSGNAAPFAKVEKLDMAYALVQMLGLQSQAEAFDPQQDIIVDYRGNQIVLADQDAISDDMKGYVQLAINLSLVNVSFGVEQGPFDLEPSLTAHFNPTSTITRAHYAELASRFYLNYFL